MADKSERPEHKGFTLRDVSGSTIAVATLAVLGAAAIVSAPLWVWYWRKRHRTDAMASQPPAADEPAGTDAPSKDAAS